MAGRLGKFPPFMVGWMILIAFFGGQCSIALQAMFQATAMRRTFGPAAAGSAPRRRSHPPPASTAEIFYYGFDTELTSPTTSQGGEFGIGVAVIMFGAIGACLPMRLLNKFALASFTWLLLGALTLIIVVPAVAPAGPNPGHGNREDTAFVFRSNTYLAAEKFNGLTNSASWLGSETSQRTYIMAKCVPFPARLRVHRLTDSLPAQRPADGPVPDPGV